MSVYVVCNESFSSLTTKCEIPLPFEDQQFLLNPLSNMESSGKQNKTTTCQRVKGVYNLIIFQFLNALDILENLI